jgi:hypothetical protein
VEILRVGGVEPVGNLGGGKGIGGLLVRGSGFDD